ncbi:MAG: PAS domain-containing protein, partial [Vicinamibacterales bacterium]
MSDALSSLRGWLAPPVLETDEKTQRARTFHRVVWLTVAIVCFFVGTLMVSQPSTALVRLQTVVAILAAGLAVLEMSRRGHLWLATRLFVLVEIALITQRAYISGGITNPVGAVTFYVVIVLQASVLLNQRDAILTALACAGAGLWLVIAELHGALPVSSLNFPPLAVWLYGSMWLGLALVLQREIGQTLGRALRRTEAELADRERAERRLTLALDAGRIGAWDQDPTTGLVTADRRLFDLYGIPAPPDLALSYAEWIDRVHPEDRGRVDAVMAELATRETTSQLRFRALPGDGTTRHVDSAALSVCGPEGAVVQIVGVNIDATERVEAETERARLLRDLAERVKELTLLHRAASVLQQRGASDRDALHDLVRLIPAAWSHPECCEARIAF